VRKGLYYKKELFYTLMNFLGIVNELVFLLYEYSFIMKKKLDLRKKLLKPFIH